MLIHEFVISVPASKGSVTIATSFVDHQLEAPGVTGNQTYVLTLENSYGGAGTGITVTGFALMILAKSA